MSRDSQRHYTLDDYFAVEEVSEIRHEFYNGEIFAMAGASLPHNEISANVLSAFRTTLRDSNCGAYGSDLRVQTPSGLYTYPDVSVICGSVQLLPERSATATNPVLLVEVLSDATEDYDRGEKFTLYKPISTLRHYLLISQNEILVDHFVRRDNDWQLRTFRSRSETIELADLGIFVAIDEVYRRVF